MTTGKAVAKVEETSMALAIVGDDGQRRIKAVQEALGGEDLALSMLARVKTPTGGGKQWDTPAGLAPAVEGVLVHRQPTRTYWRESFDATGGGTPPDCYAPDGFTGVGTPGGDCKQCPYSKWGSDPRGGSGQACSQITNLFMLTEESGVLPWFFRLSPTNFTTARDYAVHQAAVGQPYHQVVTRVGLEQDHGGPSGKIEYSKATFAAVRPLTDEERAAVEKYRADMVPHFQAMLDRDPTARAATE